MSIQNISQSVSKSSESLWDSALSKLDQHERETLESNTSDKLAVVTHVSQIVRKAEEICISKQWRYKRNNGETVILRDVIVKITKWIERFKAIGDAAVQYDPLHAALPWAGVRFLLEIAVGHVGQFDFLVEGAEMIAYRIDRCAILESIYFSSTSFTLAKLKDSLTILYTAILKYLVKARHYFQQRTAVRVLKAAIVPKTDFELLAADIVGAQNNVNEYAALIDGEISMDISKDLAALSMEQSANSGLLRTILNEIDGPLYRIDRKMQTIEDHSNVTQRVEMLDCLSSEPYLAYHAQNHRGIIAGTGQWLLDDPLFIDWRCNSVSSLLWLHGMSGTGKTKLVSLVVQHFIDQSDADQCIRPVYFYCSRDNQEPARSSPSAILASIARQLASVEPGSPMLPPASNLIQTKRRQEFNSIKFSTEELTGLIIQLTAYYPVTTIVLDALDECNCDDRYLLLDAIHDILTQSMGSVKVFLSSREEGDLTYELRDHPNLRISSTENSRDIERFVRTETEKLVSKGRLLRNSAAKAEIKNQIIEKLIEGANGMFRWVTLKLEALVRRRDEDVLEQLERLPQKLADLYHDTYQDLLKGKSDIERSLIHNSFKWLLCGQVSVTSNLFCVAITQNIISASVSTTRSEILDLCANFVVHDKELDRFRFAHPSVLEFLQNLPAYALECCHMSVAESCLASFLKVAGGPLVRQTLVDRHLYRPSKDKVPAISTYIEGFGIYSIRYGIIHCKKASTLRSQGLLQHLFRTFFLGRRDELSLLPTWIQWAPEFQLDVRLRVALFEASKTSVTSQEKHRCFAYLIGCAQGFPEIVSYTLQYPVDIDVKANGLLLAMHNEQQEILTELSSRRQTFLTKDVLTAVLRDMNTPEWKRDELIQVFLHVGDAPLLPDTMVKWSCGSLSRMAVTLFCFGDIVFANDDFLRKVIGQEQHVGTLSFVLRHGGRCAITEHVVRAATTSLDLVLRKAPMITPEIVIAAIENPKFIMGSLETIESRTGPVQMNPAVIKAVTSCKNDDVRQELLLSRGLQVTPELVKWVVTGTQHSWSWAYNASLLKQLLVKCPDVMITQDIFDVVLETSGVNVARFVKILLEQRNRAFRITEDNVEKALRTPWRRRLVPILLSHSPALNMTKTLIKHAVESDFVEPSLLGKLLQHDHAFDVSADLLQSAILRSAISIEDISSNTGHRSEPLPTPMPPQMDCLMKTQKLFASRNYSRIHRDLPDKDPSNFLRNLYTLFGPEEHSRITYDLLDRVSVQLKSLSKLHILLAYGKDVRVTYDILERVTRLRQISCYAMNILWKRMIRDDNAEEVLLDGLQHHLSGRNEHGSTAWALLLLWYGKSRNDVFYSPDLGAWQESWDLRLQLLTRMPHHQRLVESFCEKYDVSIADGQATNLVDEVLVDWLRVDQ